jgi:hypothetical protein
MSRYKWVNAGDGRPLYSVGVLEDGTLYNPTAILRLAPHISSKNQLERYRG